MLNLHEWIPTSCTDFIPNLNEQGIESKERLVRQSYESVHPSVYIDFTPIHRLDTLHETTWPRERRNLVELGVPCHLAFIDLKRAAQSSW